MRADNGLYDFWPSASAFDFCALLVSLDGPIEA